MSSLSLEPEHGLDSELVDVGSLPLAALRSRDDRALHASIQLAVHRTDSAAVWENKAVDRPATR